jgi:hydroxymethylbilane synthase
MKNLRIGTRGSKLALWQTNWIKRELDKLYPDISISIVKIKTTGDKILDSPLAKIGGKGLFVKEIEEALLRQDIDLAVHSMKDVPADLPEELMIGAATKREDPRDVLISRDGAGIKDLKIGATIGTTSLRRKAQMLHLRPDFVIASLRGNLDTRIKKIYTEGLDGIVVAAAGVKRLCLEENITEYIDPQISIPAIGQGALAIEIRKGDDEVEEMIKKLDHKESHTAVFAERAFLKRLEGGCQTPIAAHGIINEDDIVLYGMIADVEGSEIIRDQITGKGEDGETLGVELAERLLKSGGSRILEEIYKAGNQ